MNPFYKNLALWMVIGLIVILLFQLFQQNQSPRGEIVFSDFLKKVETGEVREVTLKGNNVSGRLSDGSSFRTYTADYPDLVKSLKDRGVKIDVKPAETNSWLAVVLQWVPMLLFIGVWIFFMRQMQGGGAKALSFGKARARLISDKQNKVTFQDVAGVDEAKEELREIIEFLKDPPKFQKLGGQIPNGVLLVGPPGTGKTLLAKAIAGEANVPFFSISGSEFVEMFVGVGAARVRDLFQQAHQKAPAIIFIDELDALGRARGIGPYAGGHDEKEQTLNQLLVELDGFDSRSGLVILAATNRPEILDPALLRAGRFDRQVLVDRPDKRGRVQILQVHMKKVKIAPDVDADKVAALTPGFTGADLANLVNEAALLATRRGADATSMSDFGNAVERIVAGLEKRNRLLNPREREIVAYHEMGHALVALALPGVDPVHKVSIIPRGIGALGYTIQRPIEDRFLMTREELENKMAVSLGGRAAELIVFGHLSTGAADDLRRVTDIARSMVTRYGMSDKLGNVAYDRDPHALLTGSDLPSPPHERDYAEKTAATVDAEVRAIVEKAFQRALDLLKERRAVLDRTAQRLLEKETLEEAELTQLANHPEPRSPQAAAE